MSEPTWVRVKDDKTGHEYSIPRQPFQGETVIDKPATNIYGEPLPAKPNLNLARRKQDSDTSEPAAETADASTTESSESSEPTDTSTGTPKRAATTRRK